MRVRFTSNYFNYQSVKHIIIIDRRNGFKRTKKKLFAGTTFRVDFFFFRKVLQSEYRYDISRGHRVEATVL